MIAQTDAAAVAEYVAGLRRAGLAGQTIRNRLGRLRQLARLAVRNGYLPAMPEIPVPRPGDAQLRTPVTEDELVAALAGAGAEARAAILLAADAGLRRMEVAGLDGADVDLAGRWLTVRRGKGGRPRQVPILTERLLDALEACRPEPGVPVSLVSSPEALDRLVDGRISLHRCRHYRASTWANDRRIPLPTVMVWLGHSRLATTQRYVHARPEVPEGLWEPVHNRSTGKVVRMAKPRVRPGGAGRNRTDE